MYWGIQKLLPKITPGNNLSHVYTTFVKLSLEKSIFSLVEAAWLKFQIIFI